MSDPLFFKSKSEIQKWFKKNHKKMNEQWMGIYKKNAVNFLYSANDISDVGLCFGWTAVALKSIDYQTYKILYKKRKENSTWSQKTVKRFLDLKKEKRIQSQGQWAFDHRDHKKSEQQSYLLTKPQISKFKKNKKAWLFFESQTESYKKYMIQWVASAIQTKTKDQRFQELLHDSENQTQLLRLVKLQNKALENKKNKYPAGQTPIEEAKNFGPVIGSEFRSFDLDTVEKLKSVGWEKAMSMWINHYPHRLHMIAAYSVIGAIEDQDYQKLDPELKAECKSFVKAMRSGFR